MGPRSVLRWRSGLLAALLLGERVHPRFWFFAVPALVGAWPLSFPEPLDVGIATATAGLLAVGAAALWAAGTVLGRLTSAELTPTTPRRCASSSAW